MTPDEPQPGRPEFLTIARAWVIGLLVTLAYELPLIIRGPRSSLTISDSIEPNVGVLAQWFGKAYSAPFGEPSVLTFLLGGLPGAAASPEIDASGLFFSVLPPYWAYVGIDLTLRIVAFAAMMSLLGRVFRLPALVMLLSSVCFALIPHWTVGFLSVTGLPLVALGLITCAQVDRGDQVSRGSLVFALGVFFAFPFFSSLPLSGLFVFAGGGVTWVMLAVRRRRPQACTLLALALLGLGIAIANRSFVEETLFNHAFVWQRMEFNPPEKGAWQALLDALYRVRSGEPTAATGAAPVAWALIALYVIVARPWKALPERGAERLFLKIAASVFGGFILLAPLIPLLAHSFPAMQRLSVTRICVFFPALTYVLLAIASAELWNRGPRLQIIVLTLLTLQLGRNVYRSEWMTARHLPSFEAYTASRAFDRVEALAGSPRDRFKIACVGFPPSVAHLNNFQTVDGYWYLYPLEYKHRFRAVVEKELVKNTELSSYFDNYGSRLYVFSAELWEKSPDRFSFLAERSFGIQRIEQLSIDTAALAGLGANLLVSAVEIGNADTLDLGLVGRISEASAAMDLYVYRLPE